MTLIDLGDFKIRFDPKEVRISIDGDLIDIGRVFSLEEKKSCENERRDITRN